MKKFGITILFIFTILLLPLFPYVKANGTDGTVGTDAAPQTSIGISPAIIEVVLDQSKQAKQEISVFNLTDDAIPIRATKASFTLQEKSDLPSEKLQIYDASSWITISDDDTDFILAPKEIKKITLVVNQPDNSSPGGHYATVYFQALSPDSTSTNNSAKINIRLGVLVLIQVPGDIIDELKIKELSSNLISDTSKLTFNLSLENTGNVHLLPTGKISFYNDLTQELLQSVTLDNKLVLPGLVNTYTFKIDPGYQIGKISAQAVINYGATNKVLDSGKTSVYIFPYQLPILILAVLLFIIFLRKRAVKAIKILFERRNKIPDSN